VPVLLRVIVLRVIVLRVIVLVLLATAWAHAQALNSGSNGSDGALDLTTPGVVTFDPAALGLDADRDNVFHFTTINIDAGVTVKMPFNALQGLSVIWLAQGAVQIAGTIDLNGQDGAPAAPGALNRASVAGPGGYPGGVAYGGPGFAGADLRTGLGPGGGRGGGWACGDAAGHADTGWSQCAGGGSAAYGNALLVPLRGGSGGGGAGDANFAGGGGGAGGGGLRIFSSTSIGVTGAITANGGNGGVDPTSNSYGGGGGSGGSIHLIAPTITGSGTLSAAGGGHGISSFPFASRGRIRLEATINQFAGTANAFTIHALPYNVPLPAGMPIVRVTSIGGIAVSPTPTGDAATPDVTFNQSGPVVVGIEARNVPVGTVLQVRIMSGVVAAFVVNSTPLAGTLEQSTATASVTFPPGFSSGLVRATWNPPAP
jgi:hypothetical protein